MAHLLLKKTEKKNPLPATVSFSPSAIVPMTACTMTWNLMFRNFIFSATQRKYPTSCTASGMPLKLQTTFNIQIHMKKTDQGQPPLPRSVFLSYSSYSPISSCIRSCTVVISWILPTSAPQKIRPFSTSPCTARVSASVMQYGIFAGSQFFRHP